MFRTPESIFDYLSLNRIAYSIIYVCKIYLYNLYKYILKVWAHMRMWS